MGRKRAIIIPNELYMFVPVMLKFAKVKKKIICIFNHSFQVNSNKGCSQT